MDRLVVSKSLTADMEGDAAGGVVDMVMKDAPSRFQIQANAAIGASDYFWKDGRDYLTSNRSDYTKKAPYEAFGKDYKAQMSDFKNGPVQLKSHSLPAPNFIGGLSIGNRFWNDRLGVMLAGSVQNVFRGTERTYNSVKMASGEQAMYISNLHHRYYSIHDLTTGAHAKIDLTLPGNKLEWYNMYVRTNSKGIRYNNSVNTEYIGADSYTQDDEVRSLSTTQHLRHQPEGYASSYQRFYPRLVGRILAGKGGRSRQNLRLSYEYREQNSREWRRCRLRFHLGCQQEHHQDSA